MSKSNPADQGIAAARQDREAGFMMGLLDEFKVFVADQMSEGMHAEFNDHHDFLKACMEQWVQWLDEQAP